eukprot:7376467-Prymnesium_polylepis.4
MSATSHPATLTSLRGGAVGPPALGKCSAAALAAIWALEAVHAHEQRPKIYGASCHVGSDDGPLWPQE